MGQRGKSHPGGLKQEVYRLWRSGKPQKEIAAMFDLSQSSIARYISQVETMIATNRDPSFLEPRKRAKTFWPGRGKSLDEPALDIIKNLLQTKPKITLEAVVELLHNQYGYACSNESSISRFCSRRGFSIKEFKQRHDKGDEMACAGHGQHMLPLLRPETITTTFTTSTRHGLSSARLPPPSLPPPPPPRPATSSLPPSRATTSPLALLQAMHEIVTKVIGQPPAAHPCNEEDGVLHRPSLACAPMALSATTRRGPSESIVMGELSQLVCSELASMKTSSSKKRKSDSVEALPRPLAFMRRQHTCAAGTDASGSQSNSSTPTASADMPMRVKSDNGVDGAGVCERVASRWSDDEEREEKASRLQDVQVAMRRGPAREWERERHQQDQEHQQVYQFPLPTPPSTPLLSPPNSPTPATDERPPSISSQPRDEMPCRGVAMDALEPEKACGETDQDEYEWLRVPRPPPPPSSHCHSPLSSLSSSASLGTYSAAAMNAPHTSWHQPHNHHPFSPSPGGLLDPHSPSAIRQPPAPPGCQRVGMGEVGFPLPSHPYECMQ
ncbi:unnamed protein product [Vitrella brassicaformis CCMP3155]|uniref:Uncharacterized protein n=2 Tax=Vitrella brassicaformis TaxID=1169539 RepID=A0A0G4EE95_VITBC|nr:unnamed protein product [Vitrella brassicaformis CCMP3155]|eukprot:CEL93690.1 unnamed protein product [Vitrella brassicaformis CCMP3155]